MDLFTYCSFVVCCGKFVCVSAPILLKETDLGLEGKSTHSAGGADQSFLVDSEDARGTQRRNKE